MAMDEAFPPFDPDGPEGERAKDAPGRKIRNLPLKYVVPNLITVMAICAGLTAIRMALEERFELAVALVLLAAFLDGIDGRAARLLKSSSRFGAEMDSLADAINFGVVPALLLYTYMLDDIARFGWTATLIYAIACVLRLARFNVMSGDIDRPKWQRAYFVGIPAPAGAALVLLPVYLGFLGFAPGWYSATIVPVYTIIIAFLMVSNLPVWSGKTLGRRIKRSAVIPLILCVVLYVALLFNFTWTTLSISVAAYIAFLPYSVRMWRRARKKHEAQSQA